MLDINLIRKDADLVKENIKKKFQDEKLVLVDEVLILDDQYRASKTKGDELRAQRNSISKEIGFMMKQGKKEEAEKAKQRVNDIADEISHLEEKEETLQKEIRDRMLVIPNIIDPSVPLGKDDSENVVVAQFGEAFIPAYDIPYHVDIMESLNGIELEMDSIILKEILHVYIRLF